MNKLGGFFSKTAAIRYNDLAKQMRQEASQMGASELKGEMLRIAEGYDRLARWAKMLQPSSSTHDVKEHAAACPPLVSGLN